MNDLNLRFTSHAPPNQQVVDRHKAVRDACYHAAVTLLAETGEASREQSLAITKLEEAMFWANAAIARNISAPANAL